MLSHDFTTKLTHINVSSQVKRRKKKQFSYNFTKKKIIIFQVCSAEKKNLFCLFSRQIAQLLKLVRYLWFRRFRDVILICFEEVPNDKYLPCNRFSVSQNFCNSWKYLSRMYTFDMPATFCCCWNDDDVSITL